MAQGFQNSLFSQYAQLSQNKKVAHTHEGLRSFLLFYLFTFLPLRLLFYL